jgi:polyisoprenoid-binding protein YceI
MLLKSVILAAFVFIGLPLVHAADTYKLDSVHSFVIFKIKHFNTSNTYGRFNAPSGTLVVDEADPTKSTVEVEVKSENVDTNEPKRDQHLKKADFLDAVQFPAITFKSKTVAKGKEENSVDIDGELTLHGVTKPVKVTFVKTGASADPKMGTRVGYEGTFTIKRSDYGMNFMVGPVGDDVQLTVAIEAAKQ